MECISISHKTAGSTERQRCFIPREMAEKLLGELLQDLPCTGECAESAGQIEQCVILSTCNRTELYVQGRENVPGEENTQGEGNVFARLEEVLAEATGESVEWIRSLARRYQGRKAIRHLFQVTCGMESMVIGEDEILGQVRDAYTRSQKMELTGYELNTIFQAALACAKRVKTQTELSKTSVSVATLASSEVFRFLSLKKAKPSAISKKTILLIGSTGQMGSILLKDLLSREGVRILATSRSHQGMLQSSDPRVQNVDYRDRYACLDEADVIVSATTSPHYTVTAGRAEEWMKTDKDRLFVDISMPPDIDDAVREIPHCRLISLEDIKGLARENNQRKQQALTDAGEILVEEVDKVCNVLAFHHFAEQNDDWRDKYADYPAEKLVYLLRDELDGISFEAVLKALGKRCRQ